MCISSILILATKIDPIDAFIRAYKWSRIDLPDEMAKTESTDTHLSIDSTKNDYENKLAT